MTIRKKRLFIDMDGTLAEWRSEAGPEELYKRGYFASLRPYPTILHAVQDIWLASKAGEIDIEMFILSAYLPDALWAKTEKLIWLDRYLPEMFDDAHRLFVPCNSSKLDYVPRGVDASDFLLDDYTLNLREWNNAGGKTIKVYNGCNGKKNPFWRSSVDVRNNRETNRAILRRALHL